MLYDLKKVLSLFLTLCIFSIILPTKAVTGPIDLDNGLIINYKFENSLIDSSCNKLNGALATNGNATYTLGKDSESNSVVVTGSVNAENIANFQIGNKFGAVSEKLDGASVITLSFWVKKTVEVTKQTDIAKIYCGGSSSGIAITYGVGSNANKLKVSSRPTSSTLNNYLQSSAWIEGASINNWMYCVVKLDYKSKVIQVILNGDVDNMITTDVVWNTGQYTDGTIENNSEQVVSDYISTSNSVFDDFRIYNRALSYDEIKTLYNNSHMVESPALYYDFENNLNDKSSSNINGLLDENTSATYVDGKFGKAVSASFSIGKVGQLSKKLISSQTVTIAFWGKKKSNLAVDQNLFEIYGSTMPSMSAQLFSNTNGIIFSGTSSVLDIMGRTACYNVAPVGVWTHYVIEYDYKNKKISVTINGNINSKLVTDLSTTWTYDSYNTTNVYKQDRILADNMYIDELYVYSDSMDDEKIIQLSGGDTQSSVGILGITTNNRFCAGAVYNNYMNSDASPVIAIASYNNKGQLIGMKCSSSKVSRYTYGTLSIEIEGDDSIIYVRAFLFNEMGSIMPLAKSDVVFKN